MIKITDRTDKNGIEQKKKRGIIRRLRSAVSFNMLPFVLVLPLILYAIVSHHVTVNRFDGQEETERKREARALSYMLDQKANWLETLVHDYAEWDETCAQVKHPDYKWMKTNILGWVPKHYEIDCVLLMDCNGNIIASKGVNDVVISQLRKNPHLTAAVKLRKPSKGLIRLGGKAYLIATDPVIMSSKPGPVFGCLMFAKCVDSAVIEELVAVSPSSLCLYIDEKLAAASDNVQKTQLPNNPIQGCRQATSGRHTVVELSKDKTHIFVWHRLLDWDGKDLGIILTSCSRDDILANLHDAAMRSIILIASCLLAALLAALQMRAALLARHAHTDELTGIYNHRYLQERLTQEVSRSKRYARPLSIALLDIDHFKYINDEYGHLAGDQALRSLADLLKATVRDTDVVARYGGEEFLVIMPETRLRAAVSVAERLRAKVEEAVFDVKLAGTAGRRSSRVPLKFTISVGVATCPVHAEKGNELIMAADLALFAAKNASRNAVRSYNALSEDQPGKHKKPITMYFAMREGSLAAVRALAAAVDARDHTMRGHSEKVALYSLAIGQGMGFSDEEMNTLRTAALLHDVGRIAVPDAILWKPGELTEQERTVVMTHSAKGAEILEKAPQLKQVAEIVRSHHERYDGKGYPDKIAGEDIPLQSRIICVADAFDAITSDRPYRRASVAAEAVRKMNELSGTQFDPNVIEVLSQLVHSGELFKLLKSMKDELDLAA